MKKENCVVRYAVVENEPLAVMELESLLKTLRPEWERMFVSETVEDSVRLFKSGVCPDLIFMDIELDDGDSFDIFRQVDVDSPIIFITAYDSFCLQAFKVNSVDYLLKPLDVNDLGVAITKFEKCGINKINEETLHQVSAGRRPASRILIASGDRYGFIASGQVAWFVSEDKYVFVVTHDGKKYMTTYATLGDVERDMDPVRFHRLSRKFICTPEAIESVSKYFKGRLKCHLRASGITEQTLVSSDKREEFLSWLGAGG